MVITFLVFLSAVLTLVSVLPYLRAVVKKKTKPRIVSWFTWSVLTAIGSIAAFSDGHYATTILLAVATVQTMSVVVLGYRNGDKQFAQLDIWSLTGAIAGLFLWVAFNSPMIAVVFTVAIDFVGGLPTFFHAWDKPDEETAKTFALSAAGSICTLLAVEAWSVTSVAYPLYITLANAVIFGIILYRRHNHPPADFDAVEEL